MKNYKMPLTEKIQQLESEGYKTQFKFEDDQLVNTQDNIRYNPQDISLINEFRFEGESNPSDMSILYVLEGKNGDKGTIVNAYGAYADVDLDEFMKKVNQ